MKVSIEKELDKKVQSEREIFEPLKEVKLLLERSESEDARILRELSNESQFNRVERLRSKQLDLENMENKFDGRVYHVDQIKELAVNYRLRFLPSKYFTGAYDTQVAGKIKEFSKKTNVAIESYSLKNDFFILAPQEMFALHDEKYITKKELRRQLDPVIFYRIDSDHYRLIHKWGDDFTIFRLIEGFAYRSWWHNMLVNTFLVLPIVSALFTLLFFSYNTWMNYPIWSSLLCVTSSFLFAYFRWGWGKHDEGDEIKGFFSPHNWNSDSRIKRK